MNYNGYNEIINGEETYQEIASSLLTSGGCYIGWTDEEHTHLDILFTYGDIISYGHHQRGIRGTHLFVSIMSHSAYGFNTRPDKAVGYIEEKLRLNGKTLNIKLTELINGVCEAMKDEVVS